MTQGLGFVLLGVGALQQTIEDIVGADMNQPRTSVGAEAGNPRGRLCIDSSSRIWILLTPIDIGGGGTVHDHIASPEGTRCQASHRFFRIREIDLGARQRHHLGVGKFAPATDQGGAKTAVGSKNQNLHPDRLKRGA